MSWLSRVGQWFRNERTLAMPPPQWSQGRWLPLYDAGTTLTFDEALLVSVVWACMDVLVRSIAPRPWNVYSLEGDKRTLRKKDPLCYLLNTRPNPEMTAIALREALQYSAIGWGDGYAEIVRDGRGVPAQLWPLEPDRVVPWRNEESGELGYRVTQFQGNPWVWVPASTILHIRGPAQVRGVQGTSLLVRASRAIAIASSAQQFSASFHANGGVLAGVLESDKNVTKPTIDSIRDQWAERYAGPKNAGKPLVLPLGLKWKEIASDPNKAQLLETRKHQVAEIARYFGVPLQKIQVHEGSQGYGTNIEQLGVEFVRDVLRPWAERFEQEADYKLIAERAPYETKIDLSELMTGDFKSQVEGVSAAVKGGLLSVNEARERFGWNHIGPDGDMYVMDGNVKTLEQIAEPPEPPAPALPAPATADAAPEPADAPVESPEDSYRRVAYAMALGNHARRWKARTRDLAATHRGPDLEKKLAEARADLRPKLAADLAPLEPYEGTDEEWAAMATAIENGEQPMSVASRFVAAPEAS